MPGASENARPVKIMNANWNAGPDGDDGRFEVMVVTSDDQQHVLQPSPVAMTALVALAEADTVLVWDPDNRTLIAANLRGTMPWTETPIPRRGDPMKYVLFVCTHNAGRSQIAQAFFERLRARRCPRGVGRPGARERDLARGGRGDARGRHRPVGHATEEDRPRDAAPRRLGDHARLRQARARTSPGSSRTGTSPIPPAGRSRRCARSATSSSAAFATSSTTASTRSAATAARTTAGSRSSCRRSWRSSRGGARRRRSARVPTPCSAATTKRRCARSCSRSPTARTRECLQADRCYEVAV